MRFNFIGEVDYNGADSKVPFYREFDKGCSLNLICIEGKNNRAFLEMPGFKNDPIKTRDTNGNEIEVAWADRTDPNVMKNVAGYMKNVITLNEKRYEFLSSIDFIAFVKEHLDEIKGKRYQFTGNVSKNEYKGKITDRFQIQNMYEITDENKKNSMSITGDFFFGKDSIDTAEWSSEKKIYLNGWSEEYIDKNHKNVLVARQLVFDCSKINFEEERHVQILSYRLKQIGLALDEKNAIVSKLKKNKYYKIAVICRYVNGVEDVGITMADLTDNQKMALELGIVKDIREFATSKIYGDRITIFKLKDFDLRGDYADGCVDAAIDDFESRIYTPMQNENIDQAFSDTAMNPPEEASDDDDDDLFD